MKISREGYLPRWALGGPASGTVVEDPGGIFGGFTNLQDILTWLVGGGLAGYLRSSGGEVHVIDTSHPTLTGTATFDLANGNVHPGTLTGNVTISTTGWPASGRGWLQFKITGDGTSTTTFSGVTWDGQDPPGIIGSTEVLHGALWSDDGGTVIWGGYRGSEAVATDGMVPYLIESGETFTVPVKKQALFNEAITVDAGGSLVVIGHLLMVT